MSTATGHVTTDKEGGKLHWVVTHSAAKPTAEQILSGTDHYDNPGVAFGEQDVVSKGAQSVAITGLTNAVEYCVHFLHVDRASRASNVESSDVFVAGATDDFVLTDNRKMTGAIPTFVDVDLGTPHVNREIVIELSYASSSGSLNMGTTTVTVGSVTLTQEIDAYVAPAGLNRQRSQIFRGRVPDGAKANITVTNTGTATATAWSMLVWRGLGPYWVDYKAVANGSLSTGGKAYPPGNSFTFAVSSNASSSQDASLTGIHAIEQNISIASYHRGSHGYEALGAGLREISAAEAKCCVVMALRRGNVPPLNIALLSADVAHAAATNTMATLVGRGHSVTLIADSEITTTDFSSFDLIVAARNTGASATLASATVANQLRALVNSGKPLVVGGVFTGGTGGTGRSSIATLMNLTGTWTIRDSSTGTASERQDSTIIDIGHAITDGFDAALLPIYSASQFRAKLTSGQPYVGVRLANGAGSDNTEAHLIAIPAGTTDLASGTVGARVVVGDIPYSGQGVLNARGATLLNRMCLWAAGKI